MTLYKIRGFISMNLNSICSDSSGSIQAPLKRLVDSGWATYKEFVENGLNKWRYIKEKNGAVAQTAQIKN